jgi:hypothetical protein
MTQVTEPFPTFYDDDGTPLENGMIYIGVSGLNPRVNPVAVFFDEALTVPASQPIRTLGGRPAYQGAPARLFIAETTYSIEVQTASGTPVAGSSAITASTAEAEAQVAATQAQAAAVIAQGAAATAEAASDLALAYGSAEIYATWALLAAATGMAANDVAQVVSSDTGTHTDPVVGGTVANAGVYRYSASPAGWQRIANLESTAAAASAAAAAASAIASAAAPGKPLAAFDFQHGQYYPSADALVTATTIRPAFDRITGKRIGAHVESARRGIARNDFAGAVEGGALPTGWGASGLTAITSDIGSDFIEVTISGTASGAFTSIALGPNNVVNTAIGEVLVGSVELTQVGGKTGVTETSLQLQEYNAALDDFAKVSTLVLQDVAEGVTVFPHVTRTVTHYDRAGLVLRISHSSGTSVNVTFRIRLLNLQRRSAALPFPASHLPVTSAPATSVDELFGLNGDLVTPLFAGPWSVRVDWRSDFRLNTGSVVAAYNGDTLNRAECFIDGGVVRLFCFVGGSVIGNKAIGRFLPFSNNHLVMSVSGGKLRASLNGGPPVVIDGAPTVLNSLAFGFGPTGGYLNAPVKQAIAWRGNILPTMADDVEYAYDDFNRENGTVLPAPVVGPLYRDVVNTIDLTKPAMRIENGAAVLPYRSGRSGDACYTGVRMRENVSSFALAASWDAGPWTYDMSIALIATKLGLETVSDIVWGSVHLVFDWNYVIMGYFVNAPGGVGINLVDDKLFTYSAPRDGTIIDLAWRIDGDVVTVLVPGGQIWRYKDAGFAAVLGRYAIYEHFAFGFGGLANSTNTRPVRFHAVHVEGA